MSSLKDEKNTRTADRRGFLTTAAAAGAGLLVLAADGADEKVAQAAEKVKGKVKGPHYAMLIDLTRCIGCHACTIACKSENEVPLECTRRRVVYLEEGAYPRATRHMAPVMCNHCDNPLCIKTKEGKEVCPVKPVKATFKRKDGVVVAYEKRATYKRPDGVVLVDQDRCTGCQRCIRACPYGARYLNFSKTAGGNPEAYPAEKCTYCVHRVDQGVVPSCVNTCIGSALVFGDINDPGSEISQRMKGAKVQVPKPELKTKPNAFYIGLKNKNVLQEVNPRA